MRTNFDMATAQGTYRLRCALCGREWHDSIVGKCPEREIHVCMYCCRRLCDKSYQSRLGGRACRVKDAERSAGAKKKGSLPQSASLTAPSRREPGTGDGLPRGRRPPRNDGKGDAA